MFQHLRQWFATARAETASRNGMLFATARLQIARQQSGGEAMRKLECRDCGRERLSTYWFDRSYRCLYCLLRSSVAPEVMACRECRKTSMHLDGHCASCVLFGLWEKARAAPVPSLRPDLVAAARIRTATPRGAEDHPETFLAKSA